MKYMKIGSSPDIFYTVESTSDTCRSVSSEVASDLTIQINNTTYLLHKFPLLPKCGLLQRLCGDSEERGVQLHDIPGGEEAFELCAKFCYGIVINLSAQNFVPAISAATFLRMTESVERANLVPKLEAFFTSCILQGWKDSLLTLQTTTKLPEWSKDLRIVERCINSIVEKILTHHSKVTWSYTYTRPGYAEQPHRRPVPKDWWTEDISILDIDLFRCIIAAVRSANQLPSPLIGEALHVYACRWLDKVNGRAPESSIAQTEEAKVHHRRILESIVSMIPTDQGSVSCGFLLWLLKVANLVGSSPSTKAELIKRSGRKLDEARAKDLLFPLYLPSNSHFYDIDLVRTILENFLVQFRRKIPHEEGNSLTSIYKVSKTIDHYLQLVARDVNIPASKFAALAESLPDYARPQHDDLYKAIHVYLKAHPELSKPEKKQLCRILDCQKLSKDMRLEAVRNESLPLRTLVQLLFLEQSRTAEVCDPAPCFESVVEDCNHQEAREGNVDRLRDDRRRRPKKDNQVVVEREITEEKSLGTKLGPRSKNKVDHENKQDKGEGRKISK